MTLKRSNHLVLTVLAFEGGLGLVGLLLGWGLGPWPLASVDFTAGGDLACSAAIGLLAALPAFAVAILADRYPLGPMRQLRRTVRQELVPLFRETSICGLLAISLAAGIGEELLFRGFLQAGLGHWIGPGVGQGVPLVLASLLFGACHWVSSTYAMAATGMGLLLGSLFLATGHLAAPVTAHAAYDFLVLLYLVRGTPSPGATAHRA